MGDAFCSVSSFTLRRCEAVKPGHSLGFEDLVRYKLFVLPSRVQFETRIIQIRKAGKEHKFILVCTLCEKQSSTAHGQLKILKLNASTNVQMSTCFISGTAIALRNTWRALLLAKELESKESVAQLLFCPLLQSACHLRRCRSIYLPAYRSRRLSIHSSTISIPSGTNKRYTSMQYEAQYLQNAIRLHVIWYIYIYIHT